MSFVKPLMLENGWALFEPSKVVDGALYMHHVYGAARSDYTGTVFCARSMGHADQHYRQQ